jgi:acyl-CoA-binding protein
MTIEDVFALTREFVKAKEGTKALHLTYEDRNLMNVLMKQVHYRKFEQEKSKVGFLDLVGKDRLQLWKSLGDLSKEEAMKKYVNLVYKACPMFQAHLEAHKRYLEEIEQQKLRKLEEEDLKLQEMAEQKEKKLKEDDMKLLEEGKKKREEFQRKQIQEALNQQTFPHFKAYAEQQHPQNNQAQEELIKQLQEQHFEQYMNQVYQQQLLHQQQQAEQLRAMRRAQKNTKIESSSPLDADFNKLTLNEDSINLNFNEQPLLNESTVLTTTPILLSNNNTNSLMSDEYSLHLNKDTTNLLSSQEGQENSDHEKDIQQENDDDEIELPPISAASMLTRKDIKEFKESIRRDKDAIIKVGSGETVTVRVPTHEEGRLIFWEFSTDYYDIGFGLYFEWTISPSNNVTVHVSDSSEDEEDEESEQTAKGNDIEKGGDSATENKPPCDEIIPIFRRDSHEEVYAGSHLYPGRGVYLLKFDNSYSLWRSKTLYYRVYYSK